MFQLPSDRGSISQAIRNGVHAGMTNQQIAAKKFDDRMKEIVAFDFHGIGNEQEINARYGYKHGWIVVNGQSFNMEMAFPGMLFPRFPADQGTSD